MFGPLETHDDESDIFSVIIMMMITWLKQVHSDKGRFYKKKSVRYCLLPEFSVMGRSSQKRIEGRKNINKIKKLD